jgi:hypothetical protein
MESWEDIPGYCMPQLAGRDARHHRRAQWLALAEKSQDLQGEQALALKFLPETWCEMRRLDQLRANAGSGVFVVEKYGAEQGITTPHDWL